MHGPRSTVYYIDSRQVTLSELQKIRRFSGGAFACSAAGLLKVVAAALLLAAGVAFLAAPACSGAPAWYAALPPALHLAAGLLLVVAYALFALGFAEERLDAWVVADLVTLGAETALAVAASALTLASCQKKDTLHFVPAVVGLVAALALLMDAAVVWASWRVDEEALAAGPGAAGGPTADGAPGDRPPPRKSIFL